MEDSLWFPFSAIDFVESLLAEEKLSVWEWGSGSSTFFFAKRAKALISVEHNPRWHREAQGAVLGRSNCLIELIESEPIPLGHDPRNPDHYCAAGRVGHNFRLYASFIDSFGEFDLIVVDGAVRPSCMKHAKEHVRPGGWLLLDNTDRGDMYLNEFTRPYFRGWKERTFFGHGPRIAEKWEARAWRRPK